MDNDTSTDTVDTAAFDLLGGELDSEFGNTPDTEQADTGADEPVAESDKQEEAPDAQTPPSDAEGTTDGEEPPVSETGEKEEDIKHDVEDDTFEGKPTTKDAIKEALKELEREKQGIDNVRRSLRDEIRKAYYPEGIKAEPLIDSEGKEITGVSDIAGRLINPNTGEVFSWEEAKDWYDKASQEQKDRISEAEQYLDAIAETNQTLHEGEQVVLAKYGEMLKAMPDVAKEAFEGFNNLMEKDPKTGIVIKAPDVVRYYDIIMKPYLSVARQMQAQAAAKAEEEAQAAAKAAQQDRSDVTGIGSNQHPAKQDELDKAFEEYFNQ